MDAAGMKIVSLQSGNWEIEKGNAVASAMLNEHPDLKALLAGNDSMALGAVSAVRAAGRAGQVKVVGYDNIQAIKPMLRMAGCWPLPTSSPRSRRCSVSRPRSSCSPGKPGT